MKQPVLSLLPLAMVLGACSNVGSGGDITGVWQMSSYTLGSESHDIAEGVNTADTPWVEFGAVMQGDSGCNGFGNESENPYEYESGTLKPGEVFSQAAGCLPEELMTVELIFQEVIWGHESVAVSINDDSMTWGVGGIEIHWSRIDRPPPPPTLPPQTSVGPLDCGNDVVVEESTPASGSDFASFKESGQALIASMSGVVDVEQDDPNSLVWFGYDEAGHAVVAVSFQDVSPETFSIYTCP